MNETALKEFTADDCVKDEVNEDNSRSLYFDCNEESLYEVRIESVTLQLSEEIERQNGGTVKEFASLMLNRHLTGIKEEKEVKSFFEEIST